jgi:hypothetical protein
MSEEKKVPGTLSKVEETSSSETPKPEIVDPEGIPLPPPQVMAWIAQFTQKIGPDSDTTKILAENERHAEDNRLEAYRANLDKQDRQSQRDQDFRLAQMKHAQWERYIILFAVVLAFAAGMILSINGNALGNSIMITMLPVLGILISGKIKIG